MLTEKMTDIRREGLEALTKKLGYFGTLRFLEQFDIGSGDYTKEREKLQKGYTVEKLAKEILKRRKKE